ncbi:hypothetical protein FACS189490_11930 [Clostridia bacterium]|nr:hypothetical protein FACS189490_11930 [Clostridia bacterium]
MKKVLGFFAATAVAVSMVCSSVLAADAILGAPIDRATDTGVGLTFADPNNAANDTGKGGLDPAALAKAETLTIESSCGTEQNIFLVIKTDANGWQQKEAKLEDGKAVLPIGQWIEDEDFEDVEHTFFLFVGNWDADHPMDASNTTVTVQLPGAASAPADKPSPATGDNSLLGLFAIVAFGAIGALVFVRKTAKQ